MTLGMSTLGAADHVILIVSGERKRSILRRTLHGPIGPDIPATMLRTRNRVTVMVDRDALGQEHSTLSRRRDFADTLPSPPGRGA